MDNSKTQQKRRFFILDAPGSAESPSYGVARVTTEYTTFVKQKGKRLCEIKWTIEMEFVKGNVVNITFR